MGRRVFHAGLPVFEAPAAGSCCFLPCAGRIAAMCVLFGSGRSRVRLVSGRVFVWGSCRPGVTAACFP